MNNHLDELTAKNPRDEAPVTAFELFLLALVGLSIVNSIILLFRSSHDIREIILLIESFIFIFFLADFIMRFHQAENKTRYLLREGGILDLIAGLPLPIARLARLPRAFATVRRLQREGYVSVMHSLDRERNNASLTAAVFLTIVVVEFGSIAVMRPEIESGESDFESAGDVIWWSYVTITTVGYGDYYPVTDGGRIAGILMMTIGLGLFAVVTGFISNLFLSPASAKQAQHDREVQIANDIEDIHDRMAGLEEKIDRLLDRHDHEPGAGEELQGDDDPQQPREPSPPDHVTEHRGEAD